MSRRMSNVKTAPSRLFFDSFAWLESDVCDEHGAMGAAWNSSRDPRQATRFDLRDTHIHLLSSFKQVGPVGPRAERGLDFFFPTGHVRTMGPRDGEKSEHVVCFENIRDIAARGGGGVGGGGRKKKKKKAFLVPKPAVVPSSRRNKPWACMSPSCRSYSWDREWAEATMA